MSNTEFGSGATGEALGAKNEVLIPHVLVMTALLNSTNLAMTLYGESKMSAIDDAAGRNPFRQFIANDKDRLKVFGLLMKKSKRKARF